jgi:hypothetical protein
MDVMALMMALRATLVLLGIPEQFLQKEIPSPRMSILSSSLSQQRFFLLTTEPAQRSDSSIKKEYSFDVTTPIGVEHVKGNFYVTHPTSGLYTEGKMDGIISQSYRFDVPIPSEVCSTENRGITFCREDMPQAEFCCKTIAGGNTHQKLPTR